MEKRGQHGRQECEAAGHMAPQSGSRERTILVLCFLSSVCLIKISAYEMVSSTFRVDLSPQLS